MIVRKHKEKLREKVLCRKIQVGNFVSIPHPTAIEIAGDSELNFIVIDAEHGSMSRSDIENLIRSADAVECASLVRVPSLEGGWIGSVLDSGAAGVLVPLVGSAEQTRRIVQATRYPPLGGRGCGPGRAAAYGKEIFQYLREANDRVLVAVQIETAEGVENAAEIAAVEGIDVMFIGPGDLAVSLDAFGDAGSDRLNAAIEKVAAAAKAHGRALGIFVQSGGDMARWIEHGFTFFVVGSDVFMMHQAYADLITSIRANIGSEEA